MLTFYQAAKVQFFGDLEAEVIQLMGWKSEDRSLKNPHQ